MKLQSIDKDRYSKHFKIVFGAIAVVLLGGSVGCSTLLIQLLGEPGGSNFWLNMAGVAIVAVLIVTILNKLRPHPYMTELVYVWDLKQMLNRIYRKERKIQEAAEQNDPDALVILNYFYKGSKQLYELDDNLITQDELIDKIRENDRRMQAANLELSTDSFRPEMLERY